MKFAILFCAGFCTSIFSYAQNVHMKPANKDTLKVNLTKDELAVTYKNQLLPAVNTIEALDSLMKKIPNVQQLEVDFESMNAIPEKSRAVNAILRKYNCHGIRNSMTLN